MISPGYLDKNSLVKFNPEYIKTHMTKLKYSTHFKCKEILIYEIFELKVSDEESKKILKAVSEYPEKLILCSVDDIEKENIKINDISKKIGEHAKHII